MNAPVKSLASVVTDGVWRNNAGLVQLLGLCPLLAVTNTLVNGLALGLATLAVLLLSNLLVSIARRALLAEIRIIFFVLVIAAAVSAIEQLMAAYYFDIHRTLGLFVPLIVTNCAIIGRAEAFASRNSVGRSLVDAIATGIGFALVLVMLGALREAIGAGTLFADAQRLFGANAANWQIDLGARFRLAILPPGAFFGLALLVAARNVINARRPAARAVEA